MKFLFSIPRFRIRNSKMKGNTSDIFYIISAPKGYRINYAINKIVKIQNNKEIDISNNDKIYFDGDDKVVSIRTPGLDEEINFDLIYDLLPEKDERYFYSFVFLLLTGTTIFITLINLQFPLNFSTIKINNSFPFLDIVDNIDRITGAMIPITIAVIGLLRQDFTNRTRLWLIVPLIILVVNFLIKYF